MALAYLIFNISTQTFLNMATLLALSLLIHSYFLLLSGSCAHEAYPIMGRE